MNWSILDTIDDRGAVNLITRLLDGTATLPFGKTGDDKCLKMLSARLRKVALACDIDKSSTSTQFTMNTAVGVPSTTRPGAIDFVAAEKALAAIKFSELPEFVCCDYLDGCVDDDGNPAAYLIPRLDTSKLTMPSSTGKSTNLAVVMMTPGFAEKLAAEAAKQGVKITIKKG